MDVRATADANPASQERLLVALGSGRHDAELVRCASQLADALRAPWIVIDVQSSSLRFIQGRDRDRRERLLRLADSLGAETTTLHGSAAARTIVSYARLRQVSKILIGSTAGFGWNALWQQMRLRSLSRLARDVDVLAVATLDRSGVAHSSDAHPPASTRARGRWGDYVWAVTVTAVCTILAFPIAGHVDPVNIVMIYLLGATAAGLFLGRGPATLTALTNTLAFDFFFVPPIFSFLVIDSSYLVTFSAMAIVALIIANLMIAVRERTDAAGAREHHTAALYAMTRDIAIASDSAAMIATTLRHIHDELPAQATVLLTGETQQLAQAPAINRPIAQWVASHAQRAGVGSAQFASERACYLPLRRARGTSGVLIVQATDDGQLLLPERLRLLEAFADQLALGLERARLAEVAHAAHLAAERAAMRNTLLASISHDLRTPLSAIAGAGSIVAQSDFPLDLYRRVTLGRLIEEKARDMTDLLSNVLELVRLESGIEVLSKDWHSPADLVGLAIARNESRLCGRQVHTDVPTDLPPISVDGSLIVQLIGNLIENSTKYTPPDTRILICAKRESRLVRLVVEDTGPGLGLHQPEQLFEKFARGRVEGNSGGIGLGLAICRAVARMHGGEIVASSGKTGGARFDITLPCDTDGT
jgi:two-component system sensor histidine kinase KdpD